MAPKYRIDWAHWNIAIETETGTAQLTLNEFFNMVEAVENDWRREQDEQDIVDFAFFYGDELMAEAGRKRSQHTKLGRGKLDWLLFHPRHVAWLHRRRQPRKRTCDRPKAGTGRRCEAPTPCAHPLSKGM
jgi:hypothetical protein